MQSVPAAHDTPQSPQLASSFWRSLHTPLHTPPPAGHAQPPWPQLAPTAQVTPQDLQFFTSADMSLQAPAQAPCPLQESVSETDFSTVETRMRASGAADYVAIRRLQNAYADVVTRRAWTELDDLFLTDALVEVDATTGKKLREHETLPLP